MLYQRLTCWLTIETSQLTFQPFPLVSHYDLRLKHSEHGGACWQVACNDVLQYLHVELLAPLPHYFSPYVME